MPRRSAKPADPIVAVERTTDAPKARRATKAATVEATAPQASPRKIDILLELLRKPEGTHIAEMSSKTGWQAHSVRGALSGAIGKKLGLKVSSEKTEQGRVYRLQPEMPA